MKSPVIYSKLNSYKGLQLSFYASKAGHYYNRLFNFNIKQEKEAWNFLYLFLVNNNTIHKVYLKIFSPKHEFELPCEVIKAMNVNPAILLEYKSSLS